MEDRWVAGGCWLDESVGQAGASKHRHSRRPWAPVGRRPDQTDQEVYIARVASPSDGTAASCCQSQTLGQLYGPSRRAARAGHRNIRWTDLNGRVQFGKLQRIVWPVQAFWVDTRDYLFTRLVVELLKRPLFGVGAILLHIHNTLLGSGVIFTLVPEEIEPTFFSLVLSENRFFFRTVIFYHQTYRVNSFVERGMHCN